MLQYLTIIQKIYDLYLSQPYTNTNVKFDWELNSPLGKINRPNHALAHTLRVANYIPAVIEYFQKHSPEPEQFRFSEDQIKKMQLAMLFAITGRQNDCGPSDNEKDFWQFRRDSGEHFEKYFSGTEYFTNDEISFFKERLIDMDNHGKIDPIRTIFFAAHKLDLQRCYHTSQIDSSVFGFFNKNSSKVDNTSEDITALLNYAKSCILATGDRMIAGGFHDYNIEKFALCSTNPKACLEAIQSVPAPHFELPKTSVSYKPEVIEAMVSTTSAPEHHSFINDCWKGLINLFSSKGSISAATDIEISDEKKTKKNNRK